MLTAKDFEKLNFWEDTTPEENIVVYGMDFPTAFIELTDDLGKTPTDPKASIIVAAYDDTASFLWFNELENFKALEAIAKEYPPQSEELLQALKAYVKPKKK